jgi:hypothetical protein
VIGVLSITSPATLPFQKVCGNCHVANATISLEGGVYCNDCHSKLMVQKLNFLCVSITTNDEPVLLTIKSKWLKTIVHITKSKFLYVAHRKQVQFFIAIHIYDKFRLLTTSPFNWLSKRYPTIYPISGN